MYIFGGYGGSTFAKRMTKRGSDGGVDSMVSFDGDDAMWRLERPRGLTKAQHRYGHTMTPVGGGHFIMFGGWDGTMALNTVTDLFIPS